MKVAVYSTHKFEREFLDKANAGQHQLHCLDVRLNEQTTLLSGEFDAVSLFVNDDASAPVLEQLHRQGIRFIVLRSAGFNNVDIERANRLGIRIARVPAYSPYAVAEHAVALMLALNRRLIRAHQRVMDLNFALDGLTGFDMHDKTVGIIGTGKIGSVLARILNGFGCRLLAYDSYENNELKQQLDICYTDLNSLCKQADIISLHVPLTEETKYIINRSNLTKMKPGVMLINTGRGALINTRDVIAALKKRQIGYFGMDVYEVEEGLFFEDHSENILQDDTIARLMTFQNVLITSHQAFLTDTALENIMTSTIHNLNCFEAGAICENEICIQ